MGSHSAVILSSTIQACPARLAARPSRAMPRRLPEGPKNALNRTDGNPRRYTSTHLTQCLAGGFSRTRGPGGTPRQFAAAGNPRSAWGSLKVAALVYAATLTACSTSGAKTSGLACLPWISPANISSGVGMWVAPTCAAIISWKSFQ